MSYDLGTATGLTNSEISQAISYASLLKEQPQTVTEFISSGSTSQVSDGAVTFTGFYSVNDGGGGDWVTNGVVGQTPSQSPSDLGEALLNDSEGTQWELVSDGRVNVKSLGVKGDGSDEALALQAAFSTRNPNIEGLDINISSGVTIQHPFNIYGTKGASITITDGGGYTGKTVIEVTTSEDESGMLQTSVIDGVSIYTEGFNAQCAVSTPKTPYGNGSIFSINRPRFVFQNMRVSGKTRVGGGSFTRTSEAFFKAFDIGDSDGARFRSVNVSGNLVDTGDMTTEPQLSNKETIAFSFDSLDAVYKPDIEDCSVMHLGIPVVYASHVSNPRISDSQFARCYKGILSELDLITEGGVSEAQFSNLNLNCVRSPIDIHSTDFLQLNNVRCSRSSDYDVNDTGDYHGLLIRNYCRSLAIVNFRAFISSGSYTNNFYGMSIKGGRDLLLSNIYCREDANTWQSCIRLINPETAVISGVTSEGQVAVAMMELLADEDILVSNPRVSYSNVRSDSSSVETLFTDTASLSHLYVSGDDYTSYKGVSPTTSLTDTDDGNTTVLSKIDGYQLYRYAAASGPNPYTHNLNFSNSGAKEGDVLKLWLQFNSSAGTDPTINIQINGSTQFTLVGTTTLKKYGIEVTHTGTVWVITSAQQLLS